MGPKLIGMSATQQALSALKAQGIGNPSYEQLQKTLNEIADGDPNALREETLSDDEVFAKLRVPRGTNQIGLHTAHDTYLVTTNDPPAVRRAVREAVERMIARMKNLGGGPITTSKGGVSGLGATMTERAFSALAAAGIRNPSYEQLRQALDAQQGRR